MNFKQIIKISLIIGTTIFSINGMEGISEPEFNTDEIEYDEVATSEIFEVFENSGEAHNDEILRRLALQSIDDDLQLTTKEKIIKCGGTVISISTSVGLTVLVTHFPAYYISNPIASLVVGTASGLAASLLGCGSTVGFWYWFDKYIVNNRKKMSFIIEKTKRVEEEV